jgi:hypothetical protein
VIRRDIGSEIRFRITYEFKLNSITARWYLCWQTAWYEEKAKLEESTSRDLLHSVWLQGLGSYDIMLRSRSLADRDESWAGMINVSVLGCLEVDMWIHAIATEVSRNNGTGFLRMDKNPSVPNKWHRIGPKHDSQSAWCQPCCCGWLNFSFKEHALRIGEQRKPRENSQVPKTSFLV